MLPTKDSRDSSVDAQRAFLRKRGTLAAAVSVSSAQPSSTAETFMLVIRRQDSHASDKVSDVYQGSQIVLRFHLM
jgi:hypothetical protein